MVRKGLPDFLSIFSKVPGKGDQVGPGRPQQLSYGARSASRSGLIEVAYRKELARAAWRRVTAVYRLARPIAIYWLGEKERSLCASGGKYRKQDRDQYRDEFLPDFQALAITNMVAMFSERETNGS